MRTVPAFVIGIFVIFLALTAIIFMGLMMIASWRKVITDDAMDKKLGKISMVIAIVVIAVAFNLISRGSGISGITVSYALIGLGFLVGIASFVTYISPAKARTTQQKASLDAQRTNKEVITKTINYNGHLVYFVGEPAEDFFMFQCPLCDQYYASSKAKYNITFDCNKCKNTVQITRKPAT